MLERRDVASWLEGPGAAARGLQRETQRPGERLGLPVDGPGRLAGVGPRLVAYLLDAIICAAMAWTIARDQRWTLAIFATEVLVLTALRGGSAGQLLRGLRVIRVDGRPVEAWRAALRTGLLLLFIPALIWDRDGRGMHDRLSGCVLVHTR